VSNSTPISFRIAPEHYAILRAMADARGRSISNLVRETVVEALELDRQLEQLASLFGATEPRPDGGRGSRLGDGRE
jgi:hypothetical protein